MNPPVINELILDKLPDSMTPEQKLKKIRNLNTDLSSRKQLIQNVGAQRGPSALWQLKQPS